MTPLEWIDLVCVTLSSITTAVTDALLDPSQCLTCARMRPKCANRETRMRLLKAITVGLMLAAPVGAVAQDFDKGLAAADAGDYATALTEWRPLAEQGDANAQYNLAELYNTGQGVPQDRDQASIWYRLSAEQGHPFAIFQLGSDAVLEGDLITGLMWFLVAAGSGIEEAIYYEKKVSRLLTFEQQLVAARLAVACIDASYQNCD